MSNQNIDDPKTKGMQLLQQAQQYKQEQKFDMAIQAMEQARDILIGAGIWGEQEKNIIQEEIDNAKKQLSERAQSKEKSTQAVSAPRPADPKIEGARLLQLAKEHEEREQYDRAIDLMEKAKEILVGNGIWGENEVSILNQEIERVKGLLSSVKESVDSSVSATSIETSSDGSDIKTGDIAEEIKEKPVKESESPSEGKAGPKTTAIKKAPQTGTSGNSKIMLEKPKISPIHFNNESTPESVSVEEKDDETDKMMEQISQMGQQMAGLNEETPQGPLMTEEDKAAREIINNEVPELAVDKGDPVETAKFLIMAGNDYEEKGEFLKAAKCLEKATNMLFENGIWNDEQKEMAFENINRLKERHNEEISAGETGASDIGSAEPGEERKTPDLEFVPPDEIPMDEDAYMLAEALETDVEKLDKEISKPASAGKPKLKIEFNADLKEKKEETPIGQSNIEKTAITETAGNAVSLEKQKKAGKTKKTAAISNPLLETLMAHTAPEELNETEGPGFEEVKSSSLADIINKKTGSKNSDEKVNKEQSAAKEPVQGFSFLNFPVFKKEQEGNDKREKGQKKDDRDRKEKVMEENTLEALKQRRAKRKHRSNSSIELCPMCGKIASECDCGYMQSIKYKGQGN